jgi:hypothetical protein
MPSYRPRPCLKFIATLLACMLLASCASFMVPREVEVPLARLQAGLDRRFPVDNRLLELFDVHLSQPQLSLLAGADRVGLTLQAEVTPQFLRRNYTGSLGLSGRLYIDQARTAVMMTNATVDRFELDGVDEASRRQFIKLANLLMDKVVLDVPVYSFKLEDLRYGGVQFMPTRITTRDSSLVVTLEPVKNPR